MFSADEKTIAELRNLFTCLAAIDPAGAAALGMALEGKLARRNPDLTRVLWDAASSAGKHELDLGRTLTAACCRAFCARLGARSRFVSRLGQPFRLALATARDTPVAHRPMSWRCHQPRSWGWSQGSCAGAMQK